MNSNSKVSDIEILMDLLIDISQGLKVHYICSFHDHLRLLREINNCKHGITYQMVPTSLFIKILETNPKKLQTNRSKN